MVYIIIFLIDVFVYINIALRSKVTSSEIIIGSGSGDIV